MLKYLKNENELNDLIKDGLVFLDFYAEWCGPCKMLSSVFETTDYNVVKVNTDEFSELAQKNGIMSIPTVFIYKDGKYITKFTGFRTKQEIEEIINNL